MRQTVGQILRFVGLLTEMIGIVIYGLGSRSPDGWAATVSTGTIWGIVIVGFTAWLAGSVLYWTSGPRRKARADRIDLSL